MKTIAKVGFVLVLVGVIAWGSLAFAARPPHGGGGGGCPKDMVCADIWDPVQCADGVTYSNQCYADRACAPKPCYPVDGGPVEM